MFLENLAVIIGAVVVVTFLWIIVGIRHLRYLQQELLEQWELIDEVLRKRYDLIPNLIETIRKFVNSEEILIESVIQDRQKVAKEYSKGMERIVLEHTFTHDINELINIGTKSPELTADTNYLELRKEIDDLEQNIENKTDRYNEMVRYYNKHRETAILKPISVVWRFRPETIFEVEK
ncbi:MAG: LemA family protein [Candidatus Gracilibacteria bacterium]|jgi:LemA protein